jgi:hypothetical protein
MPKYKALAHEIELGNGIQEMCHLAALSKAWVAYKIVGFTIKHKGDIFKVQTTWDYFTVW